MVVLAVDQGHRAPARRKALAAKRPPNPPPMMTTRGRWSIIQHFRLDAERDEGTRVREANAPTSDDRPAGGEGGRLPRSAAAASRPVSHVAVDVRRIGWIGLRNPADGAGSARNDVHPAPPARDVVAEVLPGHLDQGREDLDVLIRIGHELEQRPPVPGPAAGAAADGERAAQVRRTQGTDVAP